MHRDRKRHAWFGVAGVLALAGAATLPVLLVAQAPPPAPVGLSSSVQGTTVALSWAPGAGTVGPHIYQLEVGSASGAANLVVAPVQSPGLVTSGVPNGQYFVRVRTATAAGVSAPSNEIVVQVGCVAAPMAPTGLAAQVAGNNVAVGWQPPPGATGYVLEAGSAPGIANLAVVPLGAPGLGAAVPDGTYFVRVRAVNACGMSAPSADIVVSVPGSDPRLCRQSRHRPERASGRPASTR